MSDPTPPRHSWTWWPATPHRNRSRRILWIGLLCTGLIGGVAPAASAHGSPTSGSAEPVLVWSAHAQQAVVAHSPVTSPMLLGVAHVAMYDTAVALGLRGRPFLGRDRAPQPTSAAAALATAVHHVLVVRTPGQREVLDAAYAQYLDGIPESPAKRSGVDLGSRVAGRVLAWRAGDNLDGSVPYEQRPPGPGVWEPTAPTPPVGLALTRVRPLTLHGIDQFRPGGPLPLTSRRYAQETDEVRLLGRADSTARSPQQTETVHFWSENAAVQWNRAVHRIVRDRKLNLGEAARLLTAVHVSVADATLACFDAKYHFRFWRPLHAIQRADTDGNPATKPDRTWQSLLNVNHPDYPSGHACLTGAATAALTRHFHSDRLRFTVDSAATGTARKYHSFDAALADASNARVWAGLHWRHSMRDGASLGQRVAWWVVSRHFAT